MTHTLHTDRELYKIIFLVAGRLPEYGGSNEHFGTPSIIILFMITTKHLGYCEGVISASEIYTLFLIVSRSLVWKKWDGKNGFI